MTALSLKAGDVRLSGRHLCSGAESLSGVRARSGADGAYAPAVCLPMFICPFALGRRPHGAVRHVEIDPCPFLAPLDVLVGLELIQSAGADQSVTGPPLS